MLLDAGGIPYRLNESIIFSVPEEVPDCADQAWVAIPEQETAFFPTLASAQGI
jgi:hypothetical protein